MATAAETRKRKRADEIIRLSQEYYHQLPIEPEIRAAISGVIRLLAGLRRDELFRGVSDQVIRSATSVSANICEGRGRASLSSMACFFSFSRGSLFETIDHLETIREMLPPADPLHATAAELIRVWEKLRGDFEEVWVDIVDRSGGAPLQVPEAE